MKLFKVLFALMFLATGIAIEAVLAPEGICVNEGFEWGTEEFNQCVRERKQELDLTVDPSTRNQGVDSPYGPETGIVPSWQQNGSQSE